MISSLSLGDNLINFLSFTYSEQKTVSPYLNNCIHILQPIFLPLIVQYLSGSKTFSLSQNNANHSNSLWHYFWTPEHLLLPIQNCIGLDKHPVTEYICTRCQLHPNCTLDITDLHILEICKGYGVIWSITPHISHFILIVYF